MHTPLPSNVAIALLWISNQQNYLFWLMLTVEHFMMFTNMFAIAYSLPLPWVSLPTPSLSPSFRIYLVHNPLTLINPQSISCLLLFSFWIIYFYSFIVLHLWQVYIFPSFIILYFRQVSNFYLPTPEFPLTISLLKVKFLDFMWFWFIFLWV